MNRRLDQQSLLLRFGLHASVRNLCRLLCVLAVFPSLLPAQSRAASETLAVTKIDPPNWYSTLPRPLLLLEGTGFTGAEFTLSDPALSIVGVKVSANGHWTLLSLSTSPGRPETVQLRIRRGKDALSVPYRFAEPRRAGQGMAGFSPRDVLYLILTDRFADGNLANDGLHAQSIATSSEAGMAATSPACCSTLTTCSSLASLPSG